MANHKQAMREMRSMLGMFRNLHEIAEEIDRAGDVDQYIRKLKAEAATMERQNAELVRTQNDLKEKIEKDKAKNQGDNEAAKISVKKAEEQAAVIVANAKRDEEAIKAKAAADREAAAQELRDAEAKAREMIVQAKRDVGGITLQARIEAGKVEGETLQARKALEVIRSDTTAAERQLQALRSEIESLRAKFAS